MTTNPFSDYRKNIHAVGYSHTSSWFIKKVYDLLDEDGEEKWLDLYFEACVAVPVSRMQHIRMISEMLNYPFCHEFPDAWWNDTIKWLHDYSSGIVNSFINWDELNSITQRTIDNYQIKLELEGVIQHPPLVPSSRES